MLNKVFSSFRYIYISSVILEIILFICGLEPMINVKIVLIEIIIVFQQFRDIFLVFLN